MLEAANSEHALFGVLSQSYSLRCIPATDPLSGRAGVGHWKVVVSSDDILPPLQPLHTPFIARLFRDVRQVGQEPGLVDLPRTCPVPSPEIDTNGPITAPLGLRDKVGLEQTNPVSRMFERWGEVPIGLLQKTDWPASLSGYIGLEDYTLHPHIRPGSLVQIDARQTKIKPKGWQNQIWRLGSAPQHQIWSEMRSVAGPTRWLIPSLGEIRDSQANSAYSSLSLGTLCAQTDERAPGIPI